MYTCTTVNIICSSLNFFTAFYKHNVLDEEPLNSAEYARRSGPFRNDRGVGERRVVFSTFSLLLRLSLSCVLIGSYSDLGVLLSKLSTTSLWVILYYMYI